MSYGSLELTYAQPFAESLIADPAFRAWVLRRTKFAAFADEASLLHDEMRMRRTWIGSSVRGSPDMGSPCGCPL